VVVEINLGRVIVIATVGRKFNAVTRVVMMTAMVAAVVGYNVLTTSTMAENYR
jgi:predicted metallopeptidase